MNESLLETIESRVLLADGAMGTQLQRAGLEPGGCGESWNLEYPERVLAIQRAYAEAGSDCLLSNTFGASRIMLARHGKGEQVKEINQAGVRIARRAFEDSGARRGDTERSGGRRWSFVLGDVGPFGGLMEPYGDVPEARVRDTFREQADALVEAGVDAVIIETQTSLEELGVAIEAARRAGAPCVIGSMAFDVTQNREDLRTMMGVSPEDAAEFMRQAGADIVALNCGAGVDVGWAARAVSRYRQVCDLPSMAQPNAGLPELKDLEVVYKQTPEEMGAELPALLDAGARIVGGCCGSTPAHIAFFRRVLDRWLDQRRGTEP
jgi:5-methyltetrahydrofolate--homocysteine methyltransferase